MSTKNRAIAGVLLDVDGVLVCGSKTISQGPEFLSYLQQRQIPFLLLSNNSTLSRELYAQKLLRFGYSVEVDDFCTAPQITAEVLRERGAQRVFLIGEAGIYDELQAADLNVITDFQEELTVDYIVVGSDREICYSKFDTALQYFFAGAKLIAPNRDPYFPHHNRLKPGAGLVVGALEGITGRTVEIVGKPNPAFFRRALSLMDLPGADVLMIGDSLAIDIFPARAVGLKTALVMTGTTKTRPQNTSADWIFDDVSQVAALF